MAEPETYGQHDSPHPDVAGYLLGALEDHEAADFAEHLAGCDACRHELDRLAQLPSLMADLPPAEPLPPDLEARTFAAIEAAASEAAKVVPLEQARRARWRPNPRVLVAAAAAVVTLVVGVGALTTLRHTSPAPVATIRLISTTGGPAHGVATVRSTAAGLTIDMNVERLDPSPPGTFYTCWLVGPGDTLSHQNRVSVGSFVVTSSRSVHVHWTTAADLHRFPHLGITLEPDTGNPLHQGPKVLAGP
jgi:anti-sigma-K factor RskA